MRGHNLLIFKLALATYPRKKTDLSFSVGEDVSWIPSGTGMDRNSFLENIVFKSGKTTIGVEALNGNSIKNVYLDFEDEDTGDTGLYLDGFKFDYYGSEKEHSHNIYMRKGTSLKHIAEELQALYEKRLTTGDANILEVNKIKMERMNVQTEVAQNSAAHRTALQSLLAMNGNMPLEFAETTYPAIQEINDYNVMRDEVMASDLDLQAAAATARAAEKQVSVDRQGWLPKLEAGFRRNTDDAVSMNGFVVGGSLPLFQNRKKVKIAKAQAISAQLMQESAKDRVEASLMSLFNEMQQLKDAMNAYDVPLMYRSLDLLKQALTEGQISLIEYFVETESIYKNLQAYMQIENQYQKVMANIYKNNL